MSRVGKYDRRDRRAKGIRKKVTGDAQRPRLSIFRSLSHIYAQIIDDATQRTLVSASSMDAEVKGTKAAKSEKSKMVGALLANRAKSANINVVAFDRNGFLYHGRVKALADGAREAGLEF
jgi:large subunit ribosomal protein L18